FPSVVNGLEKVARALGDMGQSAEAAVPALSNLLLGRPDLESYKRQAAAEALGKIGTPRAVSALSEAAHKDKSVGVRSTIAGALKQLGATNAQAALEAKTIAAIDPDQGVREQAGAPKPMPEEKKPVEKEKIEVKPEEKKPVEKEKIEAPKDKGKEEKP